MTFGHSYPLLPAWLVLAAACGGVRPTPGRPAPAPRDGAPPAAPADATDTAGPEPIVEPGVAYLRGLMPLTSTGVTAFLREHPTYDGRGVLIAILDSGIDAGTAGLVVTSAGAPKVLDLRDFSGEGRVALTPVQPAGDGSVTVAGTSLRGTGRIARLAVSPRWYAGTFRELPLGDMPEADVNGNGTNTDAFPLIVARATDGWTVFLDTNLDGSFEDEMPLHDYRQGRETLTMGTQPITLAANFQDEAGVPLLDLYFDTSAHGTHVAGIAAGHNLYNIAGFHGVAPGAQVLGLKIANNARGGISVNGSMLRAMDYAARFAERRGLPLVLNLSFGVGNEEEGRAVVDSVVDAFLVAHPEAVFVISAGNDGPGLSTLGFPASADLALSVGATFPGVFTKAVEPGVQPPPDVVGFWSARGGELAKPEIVAPGIAYSAVPRWNTGEEVKLGTSMAAPHVAGLAACLLSAMTQERRRVSGADISHALQISARRFTTATLLDQGTGAPRLQAAYEWLIAGHQGSGYEVRTATGAPAAFRRAGPAGPGDTLDVFYVTHRTGLRAAQYLLRAEVPWLSVPDLVVADPRATPIPVLRRAGARFPTGVHVGSVAAFNPSDTLAGPLFRLLTTVVVPIDVEEKPLVVNRRETPAGRVDRYFLRVRNPGATLDVSVTLSDSTDQHALVYLFEPSGQPFRGGGERALGDKDPGTARFLVRGEDLAPGVYELDVVAPPLESVTTALRAQTGELALGPAHSDLEATNQRPATVRVESHWSLVGAERSFDVRGRGAPAETVSVRVPAWARHAEVDVQLPAAHWNLFTDFGVTAFDSSGRIVSTEPLDYAFGRHRFDLDSTRATDVLLVELFPAYVWTNRAPPWRAAVTLRFLLPDGKPLGGGGAVTVVPGGRVRLPSPDVAPLPMPEGFAPLVEVSAGGSVRRVALDAEP
ncbi:MAG TPA: S8 family serine peptidase [Gemmatimonadales bacterium]